jgi:hypothetical protein
VSVDWRRAFAPRISRSVFNDGAGVVAFANFATRIESFSLELVEFAFHAEERGLGGNLAVVGCGRKMLDVARYSDGKLAGLEERLQNARASRLHQGDHARSGKHLRKNILFGNAKRTGISPSSATYAASAVLPISSMGNLR